MSDASTSVAFIGTEGSGKTVLLATLASRFSEHGSRYHMRAATKKTEQYARRAFDQLNGVHGTPSWVMSTDPGVMWELEWEILVEDKEVCTCRMIDAAGQDFRHLFGDDMALQEEQLAPPQRRLYQSVQNAGVLVLMANLSDFVAEEDSERRLTNEWTLRFAIDRILKKYPQKRAVLVFTGMNRYGEYLKKHGSWAEVAKEYLPGATKAAIAGQRLDVLALSAVNETELDPHGGEQLIPKRGFTSTGLEELLGWIARQAQVISTDTADVERQERETKRQLEETVARDRELKINRAVRLRALPLAAGAFVGALLISYLIVPRFQQLSEWKTEDQFGVQTKLEPRRKEVPGILWGTRTITVDEPVTERVKTGERQVFVGLNSAGQVAMAVIAFGAAYACYWFAFIGMRPEVERGLFG
jgi:hypothetical protein